MFLDLEADVHDMGSSQSSVDTNEATHTTGSSLVHSTQQTSLHTSQQTSLHPSQETVDTQPLLVAETQVTPPTDMDLDSDSSHDEQDGEPDPLPVMPQDALSHAVAEEHLQYVLCTQRR